MAFLVGTKMLGETIMKKFSLFRIAAALLSIPIFVFLGTHSRAESNELLRLVQTISIPMVKGRLDHLDVDPSRLSISKQGNGFEVFRVSKNLRAFPMCLRSTSFYCQRGRRNGPSFSRDTFELVDSIQLELGPNRVAYDPHAEILYVGYGGKDAGKDYGEVALIDAKDLRSGRLGDEGLILLF
jgi:hypothetical protein